MATIEELQKREQEIEQELAQAKSKARSAHVRLVRAAALGEAWAEDGRGRMNEDQAATAEIVAKARVEALQQERAQVLKDIEAAKAEYQAGEGRKLSQQIREQQKELETAAKDAGKLMAQAEKIIYDAIDNKVSELRGLVSKDRTLTADEANRLVEGKAYRYLIWWYQIMRQDQQAKEYLAGIERIQEMMNAGK